jgi:cysteinyl-tRNA synthetase
MVNGEKMSKSKGNFFTYRDLIEKGYQPRAIRYLLLSAPHHKQLNFTLEGLQGAESTVQRLNDFRQRLAESGGEGSVVGQVDPVVTDLIARSRQRFEVAMDDDLNTAEALAAVHDFVRETNTLLARGPIGAGDREALLGLVERFDLVFNVFGDVGKEMLDSEIQALIDERQAARKAKNFARSDEIRDHLLGSGIILEDTREGLRWRRK